MPQPYGVAQLVAGDVVATRIVGEEDGVSRVEIEVQLLLAAPAVAAGVDALRRVPWAVHPARGAVVAVVLGERDDIGHARQRLLLGHDQPGSGVVLDHRVAQRGGEAVGEGLVEEDEMAPVVRHAGAARWRHRAVAGEQRTNGPASMVAGHVTRERGDERQRQGQSQVNQHADEASGSPGSGIHSVTRCSPAILAVSTGLGADDDQPVGCRLGTPGRFSHLPCRRAISHIKRLISAMEAPGGVFRRISHHGAIRPVYAPDFGPCTLDWHRTPW